MTRERKQINDFFPVVFMPLFKLLPWWTDKNDVQRSNNLIKIGLRVDIILFKALVYAREGAVKCLFI